METEEYQDDIPAASDTQNKDESQALAATEAAAALRKALALLARCEQCRSGLERKLLVKGFGKEIVSGVLDALEERGLLDDLRFARAWLNSRRIGRHEGRTRLLSELAARGISKEVSKKAVDDFFSEFDEEEICRAAAQKFLACGLSGEKLMASMLRAGFSYKMSAAVVSAIDAVGDI